MIARPNNTKAKLNWTRIALVLIVGMAWLAQNSYLDTPIEIVKNISVPFPCQFMGCGCKDAVQCWSSCGCHTDAEKFAWAKKNSVQPPEWFLEDLKTKPASAKADSNSACCCCAKSKETNQASTQAPTQASSKETPPTRVVYLNLKQRRKCQGQYDVDLTTWHFVTPADQPLPPAPISPLYLIEANPPSPVTHLPPTPPPKHV